MDDLQDFRHHSELTPSDVAIDAPPIVVGDERRMHVRAYNYWVSLLNGHDFPSIEDLDPESLADFGPHSILLDFTAGMENPSIAYLGSKLRTECDIDNQISSVDQIPPRTLISRLTDHYLQIIANRAPVGFEAEFTNQRHLEMAYRGILMPFSSDHDTIDFIYGVINWKEVVTGDLAESLAEEVDRVLAQTPIPFVPQTPAWADGPSRTAGEQIAHVVPEMGIEDDGAELCSAPTDDDDLADWLSAARDAANVARTLDSRSRAALYRAIGLAYDFALIAETRVDDYSDLLSECGLAAQERAPMTPIVKLVFGADYDKTRLTEFATALTYAKGQSVEMGRLAALIEAFDGGLKGLLKAARAAKRPSKMAVPRTNTARERARSIEPQAIFAIAGDDEFVVLVARRVDGEHVGVIGVADLDEALIDRALQKLAL